MPDLLDSIRRHVESMYWVQRGGYLWERGWFVREGRWISPHDGLAHDPIEAAISEMLAETEGRATPKRDI